MQLDSYVVTLGSAAHKNLNVQNTCIDIHLKLPQKFKHQRQYGVATICTQNRLHKAFNVKGSNVQLGILINFQRQFEETSSNRMHFYFLTPPWLRRSSFQGKHVKINAKNNMKDSTGFRTGCNKY
uniref:Uncharacterized protein n=1 Tax=Romanomermis culicivorax TaxID=13658 RepID=A0A915I031_ROMCU